ncbi:hypothetical protein LTR86_007803 [Recurvomyces mirabilis]|nr:hypothetical protein LTR86_007803 [Recurvomyces mirabilis]
MSNSNRARSAAPLPRTNRDMPITNTTTTSCPQEPTFDCAVCYDTYSQSQGIEIVSGDAICHDCFTESLLPQFLAALQHEHAYPVKWGAIKLDPARLSRFLPEGLTVKWVFKVREYATPVKERIYCAHLRRTMAGSGFGKALSVEEIEMAVDEERPMQECGNFLCARAPPTGARATVTCASCTGNTCGLCASSFFELPEQHHCTDLVDKEVLDAFEGMVKGRDYQLCPECSSPVELRDGCNHIFCEAGSCNAAFCFICGMAVKRREVEHWKKGMPCPRWNQPGAENAHHDPVPRPPQRIPGPAAAVAWIPPVILQGGARLNQPATQPQALAHQQTFAPAPVSPQLPSLPHGAWTGDPQARAALLNLEALETESSDWPDRSLQPLEHIIAESTRLLSGALIANINHSFQDLDQIPHGLILRDLKEMFESLHGGIETTALMLAEALARAQGFRMMDFRLANALFLYQRYPVALEGMARRLTLIEDAMEQ